MKKVKYLGFVGLGCAALLLTGCGGESSKGNTDNGSNSGNENKKENENVKVPVKHTLTCLKAEDGNTEKVEFKFNDKEDEVLEVSIYMSTTIPDDVDDDEVEEARDYLEENFCSDGLIKNCKTSVKGNKLQFEGTLTDDGLEEENYNGSKEEIQESLEDDGYSCE